VADGEGDGEVVGVEVGVVDGEVVGVEVGAVEGVLPVKVLDSSRVSQPPAVTKS
jgi:hypothetical protein